MPSDLVARALTGWADPATVFLAGPARDTHCFWLDAGPDAVTGWSWLGAGEPVAPGERAGVGPRDMVVDGTTLDSALPGGFGGGWVGWLGYDAGAARAGAPAREDPAAPQELWLRVDRFVAFDHAARRAWAVAPAADIDAFARTVEEWATGAAAGAEPAARVPAASAASVQTAACRHTPEDYAGLIERCRDAIRDGDAYQLCLTTRFEIAASGLDPISTYLRLRAASPAHHGGFVRSGDIALASASPETFLQLTGGIVRTRPIKGTRPRGADAAADARQARELRESPKERAENVMIVDLMRNDLQQVCLPGTVAAEELLVVESYPAVHQLVSTVAGRVAVGTRLGEVWDAAFPAGSMTGAPKLSAMEILHRLEGAPRGVYAGCFGWVGTDGRADLAMVIRSIVHHSGGAYVGAGGGITWASDAAAEVDEVGIKARAPLAALGAALPPGW